VTKSSVVPRFIVVERGYDRVFGDTVGWLDDFGRIVPRPLTPVGAVDLLQSMICDYYPYRYRKVGRADAAATFDVFRATPNFPRGATAATVERYCEHAATLARIYPTCCLCHGPMKFDGESPWMYGWDAAPVAKGRCCTACHAGPVYEARLVAHTAEFERHYAEHWIAEGRSSAWIEAERQSWLRSMPRPRSVDW
jgi:hypothetical protein